MDCLNRHLYGGDSMENPEIVPIEIQNQEISEMLEETISNTNPFILMLFSALMGPSKLARIGYPDGLYPKPKSQNLAKLYCSP